MTYDTLQGVANGAPAVWVPYSWYGPSRPSLCMPMGSGKPGRGPAGVPEISGMFTTFHEFFHIVERRCGGISPMHAWERGNLERARKYFPDWKPDLNPVWTATEYSWYRYHFLNTVPRRLEAKAAAGGLRPIFRNFSYTNLYPDHTPDWLFAAYTGAIAGIAPEQLRLAEAAAAKARSLLKQKKNDDARKELARALTLNPYHFYALRELAALAFARKDYAGAFTYGATLFRAYPEPGEIFTTALKFRDAREYRRAADVFAFGAGLPENAAAFAYWRSRMLEAAGEAAGARAALESIKDHPALKGGPGLIECRKAGASLYSIAKPSDEAAPILAKTRRGDALSWRIVPSAEKGWSLIISDYNWRCLAAAGDAGARKIVLNTMGDGDDQKWKIEAIGNGAYRIVSRQDGLALAVELRGKDKLLVLAKPNDDPLQAWSLEGYK